MMSLPRFIAFTAIALVLGFLVGFLATGVHTRQHEILGRFQLQSLTACASALTEFEQHRSTEALRILETNVDDTAGTLAALTSIPIHLEVSPEQVKALHNAEIYSRNHRRSVTAVKLAEIREHLHIP